MVDEERALVHLPQRGGLREFRQQVGFDVGQMEGGAGGGDLVVGLVVQDPGRAVGEQAEGEVADVGGGAEQVGDPVQRDDRGRSGGDVVTAGEFLAFGDPADDVGVADLAPALVEDPQPLGSVKVRIWSTRAWPQVIVNATPASEARIREMSITTPGLFQSTSTVSPSNTPFNEPLIIARNRSPRSRQSSASTDSGMGTAAAIAWVGLSSRSANSARFGCRIRADRDMIGSAGLSSRGRARSRSPPGRSTPGRTRSRPRR